MGMELKFRDADGRIIYGLVSLGMIGSKRKKEQEDKSVLVYIKN